jgi:hypothetical protein
LNTAPSVSAVSPVSNVVVMPVDPLKALRLGERIRRDVWDEKTVMYIKDDVLYMEVNGEPCEHALSGDAIVATDWRLVE